MATTLELSGVKAFPLGPSQAYADALGGAFRKLNTARESGEAALGRAGTQSAQAEASARLSTAYGAAATTLARVEVSPADQRPTTGSWRRCTPSAAHTGAPPALPGPATGEGFSAAARQVRRAGQRIERALRGLECTGLRHVVNRVLT